MSEQVTTETNNGWRPIETAPKSQSVEVRQLIDLWIVTEATPDGYRVTDCYWHPSLEHWTKFGDMRKISPKTVTHWMPLPEPPK